MKRIVSINGAIYLFRRNRFDEKQAFTGVNTYGFLMKPNDSVDIDTISDWTEAEALALREQEMETNVHPTLEKGLKLTMLLNRWNLMKIINT